jgi:predicted Ser/Thr protein kinase
VAPSLCGSILCISRPPRHYENVNRIAARGILQTMTALRLLKKDLFGAVWLRTIGDETVILRDTDPARWWTRSLARALLRREARALAVLGGVDGVPALYSYDAGRLTRGYIAGAPMHVAKPDSADYYAGAARLLRKMHRLGVVHNDLAKEPNLLVRPDGSPAIIDFQLAWHAPRRGRLFRIAGREDIRHLLKHKRTYRPQDLTQRELAILARPSPIARVWMALVKPVYLFVTRRLFGWSDREGAGDRGQAP